MKTTSLLVYLISFLAPLSSHQLQRNLEAHYKVCGQHYSGDGNKGIMIDYWVAKPKWAIPQSFTKTRIYKEIDDYIHRQATTLEHALMFKKYKDVIDIRDDVFTWITFFFGARPEFLEMLWFHKIKVITINFGGMPLLFFKVYNNPQITDEHRNTH